MYQEEAVQSRAERKSVEEQTEESIYFLVVFLDTFLVEILAQSHEPGLVVSPQHENLLWELDFHADEENEHFNPEVASVDIIA